MTRALFAVVAALLLPSSLLAAELDVSNKAGAESETDIAVDPTNPLHVVGGSNNISQTNPSQVFYESTNGGQSWTVSYLAIPSGFAFESDPAVTFDAAGNAFFAYIAVDQSMSLTLWVTQKPHGSASWSPPVQVPTVQSDKEFILADREPASACLGDIYVAWDNNEGAGQTVRVSRSTNGGATFSQPPQVNKTGTGNVGAYPAIGPTGHVYLAWANYDTGSIRFSKSTDCGVTWSATEGVPHTWSLPLQGLAYMPPSDPQRGISTMPYLAVDTTGGPHRGRIYLVYADKGTAANSGVDVFLQFSDDEGATWSSPATLNDDPATASNDQYFPRVAVDPADSSVHVVFYDTRNDPNHLKTDVYHAVSSDGAQTWRPNERLTSQMSDESGAGADGNGYGDYIGVAATSGTLFPLWTENPSGSNEDIYTTTIIDQLAVATSSLPNGLVGQPYSATLIAGGGRAPYTWTVTGLPASLSAAATGVISGTPVAGDVGPHPLTVKVTDASGASAQKTVPLTITFPPPAITTTSLPDGFAGNAYSFQLAASGGTPPYAWTASGLPASLATSGAGLISGTPANAEAGGYTVSATVTDAHGTTASGQWNLTIHPAALVIQTAALPNAEEGAVYAGFTFQVSGGVAPYAWGWDQGFAPPSGLFLGTDGHLSGTPAAGTAGTYQVRVRVMDSTSPTAQSAAAAFPLTILGPLVANPGPNQTIDPGKQAQLDGSHSTDPLNRPLTFHWTPPAGVTLSSNTSATPTTSALHNPGAYVFTLTVSAPDGTTSAPASTTVTVRNAAPIVSINAPATAEVGTNVILDARASSDPDGDSLTFDWYPVSGPDSSFYSQTGPQAQFIPKVVGTYVIGVQVSDGQNHVTGTATIKVVHHGGCGCTSGDELGLFGLGAALLSLRRARRKSGQA